MGVTAFWLCLEMSLFIVALLTASCQFTCEASQVFDFSETGLVLGHSQYTVRHVKKCSSQRYISMQVNWGVGMLTRVVSLSPLLDLP